MGLEEKPVQGPVAAQHFFVRHSSSSFSLRSTFGIGHS
jgi:hypothetical protein